LRNVKIGAKAAVSGGAIDAGELFGTQWRTIERMTINGRASNHVPDNSSSDADAALMLRIANGDRNAAQTLMQACLPRILGMARRMLNDPMEAEDVAQETFLRVWKAAERWEPGRARVSTWVSRIAINLCYDRLRKRRDVPTATLPDKVDTALDQETVVARTETSDQLGSAIAELPDRQKQAIELVHFQEMSNIEAARVMDITVDALESLLARGRRKLKSALIADAGELMSSFSQAGIPQEGLIQ
jgi:RNA polymerase sigma-70 factor (ECF subfamily)